MQINDTTIYLTDNGAALCGEHLGYTARMTGHDLSGQDILPLTPEIVRAGLADGMAIPECEHCGKKASLLVPA